MNASVVVGDCGFPLYKQCDSSWAKFVDDSVALVFRCPCSSQTMGLAVSSLARAPTPSARPAAPCRAFPCISLGMSVLPARMPPFLCLSVADRTALEQQGPGVYPGIAQPVARWPWWLRERRSPRVGLGRLARRLVSGHGAARSARCVTTLALFGRTRQLTLSPPAADISDVVSGVQACHGIIANVRSGTHWVLLTG